MSDLASIAAATAAGYRYATWQQNTNEFHSKLEKPLRTLATSEVLFAAETAGTTQAAADASVLAALNAQRSLRYGFGTPATTSTDPTSGAAQVADVT